MNAFNDYRPIPFEYGNGLNSFRHNQGEIQGLLINGKEPDQTTDHGVFQK